VMHPLVSCPVGVRWNLRNCFFAGLSLAVVSVLCFCGSWRWVVGACECLRAFSWAPTVDGRRSVGLVLVDVGGLGFCCGVLAFVGWVLVAFQGR